MYYKQKLRYVMWENLKDKESNDKTREMTRVESEEELVREQRLRWLGDVEKMDKERGPIKALHINVDGTKTMEKGGGVKYDCQGATEDGCKRLHTMEARWQKSADPCLPGRPSGPHEEKKGGFPLWSKIMMMPLGLGQWF